MAGRQIIDVALVAKEVVEDAQFYKCQGMIFELDFEKAYDLVNWNFLDKMMKHKCFGDCWRNWI